MDIEELREAREEAEAQITAILRAFHCRTGVHIVNVDVRNHEIYTCSQARAEVVDQTVMAELERI